MIATEIPVSISLPDPRTPRSPGIHVSNIIRCMATEMGILKPEWAEELSLVDARTITDPIALLRINIGLAWEEHYIPMLPGVIDHPGEMQQDGIYMTHDGESISVIITERRDKMVLLCHECKATYYSTRTVGDTSQQWMWITQIKAYCKGLGTRHAMLHVLFLCGDYKFPIRPVLKCWQLEFDQEEIDENWEQICDYRTQKLGVERDKRVLSL